MNEYPIKIRVNPEIFKLPVIFSATYIFLDRAYLFIDGDPKKEIFVNIKPKKEMDSENLKEEFMNELVNYADYYERAESTKLIRQSIIQRALATYSQITYSEEIEDPEEISKPWQEKYGKDSAE